MKLPKTKVNSALYAFKKLKNTLKEMDETSKVKKLLMNINAVLIKIKRKRQHFSPIRISTRLHMDAIAAISAGTSFRPELHREQYSINYSVDAASHQILVSSYLQRIDEDHKCSTISSREEEINELADAFIASFHQQMKLEKQKSYRNYEDMLSRSA